VESTASIAEKVVKSPYEILGVAPSASAGEIQKAYRKLAKRFHPDLNPGDKKAEETFKEAAGAYDLLSDPEKRKRFDNREIDAAGTERPQYNYYRDFASADNGQSYTDNSGFADFMDADDGFAEFLRRGARANANRRGRDLHYRLPIEFRPPRSQQETPEHAGHFKAEVRPVHDEGADSIEQEKGASLATGPLG
jgi:DnaJ-class molecular chaperone